jgi:hypothetical protein
LFSLASSRQNGRGENGKNLEEALSQEPVREKKEDMACTSYGFYGLHVPLF